MELRLRSAAAAAIWLAQCRRAAVETAPPAGQAGSRGSSGFEPRAAPFLRLQDLEQCSTESMFPNGTATDPQEQMTASLLWTFLASHMYPGVVLVFWVPSRILSLPFTKVNHDYQVHSMHLEQVSEVLCSWESEWALWGLFLLVPACSWGTRASPC